MDYILEDIGGESAEPVGGLTAEVLIAEKKHFSAIFDPPALEGYATYASLVTVAGPHTFTATNGFVKVEGVTETGTIKSTMIGSPGSQIFQNEQVIEVAGSEAELLGFLRVAKNMRFIALVTEVGTGNVRQLGSSRFPAKYSGIEHAIEAAMEGKNAVTLTIMDKQPWPAPIYTGAITMKP